MKMTALKIIDNKLFVSRRKANTSPEMLNLDYLDKDELLDLFWKANVLSFEDKQKLVTYLNAKGYDLKLFRGEMVGKQYFATEYWDGISWKEYKRDYEV
jgi:hypothetical protein